MIDSNLFFLEMTFKIILVVTVLQISSAGISRGLRKAAAIASRFRRDGIDSLREKGME